jgi:hypothetical protein
MDDWTDIITFNYGYEANLVKSKLESEDIEVWSRDELNAQVCEAGPAAVSGVKLCVRQSEVVRALHILEQGGFIHEDEEPNLKATGKIVQFLSSVPLLRELSPELAIIILIALAAILIFIPLAIIYLP